VFDSRRVARATGWKVHHHDAVGSTNDAAALLRDAGAGTRTLVVADRQEMGRGRGGRSFASPPGGLYVSLLVEGRPEDLPGPLTAAMALAVADAVEATASVACDLKWPNDLWIGRRKLGGILLETAGRALPVVVGLGLNLETVPASLEPSVQAASTSLLEEAGRPVSREAFLEALLPRVDTLAAALRREDARRLLARAWRARLVLLGEAITYVFSGRACRGRLVDVDLDHGLRVEDEQEGLVWRPPALVRDVRPAR